MKHLLKQPLFYTTILSLLALGLIIGSYVFGWTTPTASPPAGNLVLSQGALPSGSAGYVQFASSSTAFGADANFFWDNTNKRLGIGTATPAFGLHIIGTMGTTATTTLAISGGNVGIGTASPGQKLSVAGVIESTTGGIKFPDGTIQTTAASAGSDNSITTTWSSYKHYFITATTYNGNLGGLSGCDAKCNSDSNRIVGKNYHCIRASDSVWNVGPYILYNASIGSMYDKMQCWGFSCKGIYSSSHPAPGSKTYAYSLTTVLGSPYDITGYNYWQINNVQGGSAQFWNTAQVAAGNSCSTVSSGWNYGTSSYQGFVSYGTMIQVGKLYTSSGQNYNCDYVEPLLCVEN